MPVRDKARVSAGCACVKNRKRPPDPWGGRAAYSDLRPVADDRERRTISYGGAMEKDLRDTRRSAAKTTGRSVPQKNGVAVGAANLNGVAVGVAIPNGSGLGQQVKVRKKGSAVCTALWGILLGVRMD